MEITLIVSLQGIGSLFSALKVVRLLRLGKEYDMTYSVFTYCDFPLITLRMIDAAFYISRKSCS